MIGLVAGKSEASCSQISLSGETLYSPVLVPSFLRKSIKIFVLMAGLYLTGSVCVAASQSLDSLTQSNRSVNTR